MSRLDSDALVPSRGPGAAIPSRRALLSIIGAFAGLVVGLTLASPGRADRLLIERGMELVMPGASPECRAARAITGKPDEEPPGGFTFNQLLVLATIRPPARR
jgi:hypothetical protein